MNVNSPESPVSPYFSFSPRPTGSPKNAPMRLSGAWQSSDFLRTLLCLGALGGLRGREIRRNGGPVLEAIG